MSCFIMECFKWLQYLLF